MSNIAHKYRNEIHSSIEGIATWLPTDQVAIGDIGEFVGNKFHKITTLWDIGIEAELDQPEPPQNFRYSSTGGVSTNFNAEVPDVNAGALAKGSAAIKIAFSENASYLFHIHQAQKLSFKVPLDVTTKVTQSFREDKWEPQWFLIDSVYKAERATILIAMGDSASLELSVSGDIGSIGNLSLAHPSLALSVNSSSGKLFQVLNGKEITPLFTCMKMKRKFFGPKKLERVRDTAPLQFSKVTPNDIQDNE